MRILRGLQGGEGNDVRKKREKSQACMMISKWLSLAAIKGTRKGESGGT